MLLDAVVQVFEDFRYTDHTETGDTATLAFSARVGDRELDGIDLLRFDADGRIREMAVYVRPMSGVHALADGDEGQARGGRRRSGLSGLPTRGRRRPRRPSAAPAGRRAAAISDACPGLACRLSSWKGSAARSYSSGVSLGAVVDVDPVAAPQPQLSRR